MSENITVEFVGVRWVSPEIKEDGLQWGIFRVSNSKSGEFVARGSFDPSVCNNGMALELVGDWKKDPKWGLQFEFKNYSVVQPNGRWGTIAFLMQGDGIGETLAGRIHDAYGEDSIEALTQRPEEVAQKVVGLRLDVAQAAAEKLVPLIEGSKLKLPLLDLFKGTKLASKTADRVLAARIPNPVETIKVDPFMLMQFPGVAFKQCDSLRHKLGHKPDMPQRITAACQQVFTDESDQTWLTVKRIVQGMSDLLEFKSFDVLLHLGKLVEDRRICLSECGEMYGETRQVKDERLVAATLDRRMRQDPPQWLVDQLEKMNPSDPNHETVDGFNFSQHQWEVVMNNIQAGGQMLTLCGSPGTGKTVTLGIILKIFRNQTLAACAPTGKAAQRLTQSLGGLNATTIHRLLQPRPLSGGGFEFALQNQDLPVEVVAVDEASMVNNWLAASLFRAMNPSSFLILVGDQNQLPPVGPGTMLRDLQATGRFQELTQIRRNAGMIVKSCAAIRDMQVPRFFITPKPGLYTDAEHNVHFVTAERDERKAVKLQQIIDVVLSGIRVPNRNGDMIQIDPLHDVQFITATHKNPHVGRIALNETLQKQFNPRMVGEHKRFKIGDKIMCCENTFLNPSKGGEKVFVANGELGVVTVSELKRIHVKITTTGEEVLVPCGEDGNGWELGYAVTCHKSQGSEWMVTVTVMGSDFGSGMVMSREWCYTALSRARELSIVVAGGNQIREMVKKVRIQERISMIPTYWEKWNG